MSDLDLRASASRRDALTALRLDRLVPQLMRASGIDCWILVSREYAEDPVAQTMLPATWMSSRRRTILVFVDNGDGVSRAAVTRYEVDGLFPSAWNPERQANQWAALAARVEAANPTAIGVSTSESFAHADGLTQTEWDKLTRALGKDLADRIVSAEELAVGWLQTRIPEERPILEEACSIAHGMLRRALSPEAITPGTTTTADLEWWLRAAIQTAGTTTWFHPSASVQRRGNDLRGSFASKTRETTIENGDLIHIDFGIVWDHLCTDQQQHGYVLEAHERQVPDGLARAFSRANQLQDVLIADFGAGRSGNEVLAAAISAARANDLDPTIYTHPIGYHGHGAGPTIGLWDQQDGVVGPGDFAMFEPSAWSIELMNRTAVPEWDDQSVSIMLEEDAWFDEGSVEFLDGRQTEIWPI